MTRTIDIKVVDRTVTLEVVSQEAAEGAQFVICMPAPAGAPLILADNAVAACHDCGQRIQHRPTAPVRPPKICLDCMTQRAEGGRG